MHSFRELKARWALRNWRSPTGIMVFGAGWTVTVRVERISLLFPEQIPELYQSLYKAGGVFTPPPEGGGVLNSTRFGPKGPVINLEQVLNAATDAAISYLPKCRKPRVSGAMVLVLLCIFVVAGAHSRRDLPRAFCFV